MIFMKKAKIYNPSKTAMQSGRRNTKKWILQFESKDSGVDPLMGWQTSSDTMSQIKLEFSSKEKAINYAKKNQIEYQINEPERKKIIKKSYADNFLKSK
mgnify:CR=1 FL=1